jgi:L-2,4-diaminobutyric acid acetyltransferase
MRPTRLGDGARMWQFVADHGGLELNTAYAYLVLADDFTDTCVVAEDGEVLAGFVLGYRPPTRPDTLFVWQVGVAPSHRGQGLARRMILELLERNAPEVTHLESTVTPSNTASRRLFRSVAEARGTTCDVTEYLTEDHFPEAGHEAEEKFRIGPFEV